MESVKEVKNKQPIKPNSLIFFSDSGGGIACIDTVSVNADLKHFIAHLVRINNTKF